MIFFAIAILFAFLISSGPIKRMFVKSVTTDINQFKDFISNDFLSSNKYQVTSLVSYPAITNANEFPLLDFRCIQCENSYEFYIKAKYFEKLPKQTFNWCDKKQYPLLIKTSDTPLYIIIGVGGASHFPDQLFLIPFRDTDSSSLDTTALTKYSVIFNTSIDFSKY